ncbi:hypothetical protein AVEN_171849-1 [Araneus ventricosus]|uniref:Uncharacterized protein n=1 Tax=Araneus ventricosus TaxID=182803 RepID=A0A4Y2FAW2_ARAVE|nr:hypothetical protein AVEN_171849-1 [Araneus ventricosus]
MGAQSPSGSKRLLACRECHLAEFRQTPGTFKPSGRQAKASFMYFSKEKVLEHPHKGSEEVAEWGNNSPQPGHLPCLEHRQFSLRLRCRSEAHEGDFGTNNILLNRGQMAMTSAGQGFTVQVYSPHQWEGVCLNGFNVPHTGVHVLSCLCWNRDSNMLLSNAEAKTLPLAHSVPEMLSHGEH